MPTLTINGKSFTVAAGTRLVNAIEDNNINIGHRCGGKSKCTSCRVVFLAGEPTTMTAAEHAKLTEKGMLGTMRLSCQIVVDADMTIEPQMTLESVADWTDTGPRCIDAVEPDALVRPTSSF